MRLIDAELLQSALKGLQPTGGHKYYRLAVGDMLHDFLPTWIDQQPTIDPVRHGRWDHDVLDLSLCSRCLTSFKTRATREFRFCPSCGARMDLEARNE